MKCTNCGAELTEGMVVCPYCATRVEATAQISQGAAPQPVSVPVNTLVGKRYGFISTRGGNMRGIINSRIISDVEVAGDRLLIDIRPKRLNMVPVVILEDITAIDITVKINLYYWFLIVVSVFCAIPTMGAGLILTALLVWAGRQRKITISQRNGKDVVIYSRNKEDAEKFKADMKAIANIR